MTKSCIVIADNSGEERGRIMIQLKPFKIDLKMKTDEETKGLWELLRIIGFESRGIPYYQRGRISYINVKDGHEAFLRALTCALRRADLNVRLQDEKGKEINIKCEKPKPSIGFEYI